MTILIKLFAIFSILSAFLNQGGCKGVKKPADEVKKPGCICPLFFSPLCGVDGVTYSNSCFLSCAGVKLAYPGSCVDCKAKCPKCYKPVCGADNVTHKNLCNLICRDKGEFKHPALVMLEVLADVLMMEFGYVE